MTIFFFSVAITTNQFTVTYYNTFTSHLLKILVKWILSLNVIRFKCVNEKLLLASLVPSQVSLRRFQSALGRIWKKRKELSTPEMTEEGSALMSRIFSLSLSLSLSLRSLSRLLSASPFPPSLHLNKCVTTGTRCTFMKLSAFHWPRYGGMEKNRHLPRSLLIHPTSGDIIHLFSFTRAKLTSHISYLRSFGILST